MQVKLESQKIEDGMGHRSQNFWPEAFPWGHGFGEEQDAGQRKRYARCGELGLSVRTWT